jgi:predicted acetyltransferase
MTGALSVAPPGAGLRPIVEADQQLVDRLWQLYVHDLSQSRQTLPSAEGLFKLGHLAGFRDNPADCPGFLVTWQDAPAGFAYLTGVSGALRTIGEFFIARGARRRGLGEYVAHTLITRYPGSWEIAFQDNNPGAPEFWKRVASDIVGSGWREEWRPVPNKPHIAPDHWLMFTIS